MKIQKHKLDAKFGVNCTENNYIKIVYLFLQRTLSLCDIYPGTYDTTLRLIRTYYCDGTETLIISDR